MWKSIPFGFLLASILVSFGSLHAAQRGLIIRQVHIFDGESRQRIENRDVLIRGDMIAQIGAPGLKAPTPGYKELDAAGKNWTLMPAFVDLHVLLSQSGVSRTNSLIGASQADNLRTQSLAGVLLVADLQTSTESIRQLRETSGYIEFPDTLYAGPTLSWQGPTALANAKLAEQKFKELLNHQWGEHVQRHPQLTHLRLSHLDRSNGPSETRAQSDWISELARRSQDARLPLFISTDSVSQAPEALSVGADVVLNPVFLYKVSPTLIKDMLENEVAYVPSLATVLAVNAGSAAARIKQLEGRICPALVSGTQHQEGEIESLAFRQRSSSSSSSSSRQKLLEGVRQLFSSGVSLGIGSGAGRPHVFHGPGTHDEIDLFVEAGIPLPDVMRIATQGSARLLGKYSRGYGKVAEGFKANLVLVHGDPLTDPAAHRRVVEVIRRGLRLPLPKIRRTITRRTCLSVATSR